MAGLFKITYHVREHSENTGQIYEADQKKTIWALLKVVCLGREESGAN